MTLSTWILIVYLQSGALRIAPMPDLLSCIARSQFELRFDPTHRAAECVPHTGGTA